MAYLLCLTSDNVITTPFQWNCLLKTRIATIFIVFSVSLLACTEQSPVWVTQLEVIPPVFSIKSSQYNSKPFIARVKYSDGKTENASNAVTWHSENTALLTVSVAGELEKQGECLLARCIVSLIATHPESGQSQRVEVQVFPAEVEIPVAKKTATNEAAEAHVDSDAVVDATETLDDFEDLVDVNEPARALQNESTIMLDSFESETSSIPIEQTSTHSANVLNTQALQFNQTNVVVESGDLFLPSIVFSSATSQQPVASDYDCQIEYSDADTVSITAGCVVHPQVPGNARIKLLAKSTNYSATNSVLDIRVIAKPVEYTLANGFRLNLAEAQGQTWLQLNNIPAHLAHRLTVHGLQGLGAQFAVFQSFENSLGACLNTVPGDSAEVSCIIKPVSNQLYLTLYKPAAIRNVVALQLSPVADHLFAYTRLSDSQNPQLLTMNNSFQAYLLANEYGLHNRHYYSFTLPNNIEESSTLRVVLKDFDEVPGIEIKWDNGSCSPANLAITAQQLVCDLPSDVIGNLQIAIKSDYWENTVSSFIAKSGGTYYSVLVTQQ